MGWNHQLVLESTTFDDLYGSILLGSNQISSRPGTRVHFGPQMVVIGREMGPENFRKI